MAEVLTIQQESINCAQCNKNITDRDVHAQFRFTHINGITMDPTQVFCSVECGSAYASSLAEKGS
jgi:hypothetical protein